MQMLVCFILTLKGKKTFPHDQRGILTAHRWKVSGTAAFYGDSAGFGTVWPSSASASEQDHSRDAKSNLATREFFFFCRWVNVREEKETSLPGPRRLLFDVCASVPR